MINWHFSGDTSGTPRSVDRLYRTRPMRSWRLCKEFIGSLRPAEALTGLLDTTALFSFSALLAWLPTCRKLPCARPFDGLYVSAPTNTCAFTSRSQKLFRLIFLVDGLPFRVVLRLVSVPILPSLSADDSIWTKQSIFSATQSAESSSRRENILIASDGLYGNQAGAIQIPDISDDIQFRFCVIKHTGPVGHCAASAAEYALQKNFPSLTISSDVENFVHSCIHCLSTVHGERVSRLYDRFVYGTAPNGLTHFDDIEVFTVTRGEKYILILRNNHSNYRWLFAFPSTANKMPLAQYQIDL